MVPYYADALSFSLAIVYFGAQIWLLELIYNTQNGFGTVIFTEFDFPGPVRLFSSCLKNWFDVSNFNDIAIY